MELQSTNWDFQFDWHGQVQLGDLTAGAGYGQVGLQLLPKLLLLQNDAASLTIYCC